MCRKVIFNFVSLGNEDIEMDKLQNSQPRRLDPLQRRLRARLNGEWLFDTLEGCLFYERGQHPVYAIPLELLDVDAMVLAENGRKNSDGCWWTWTHRPADALIRTWPSVETGYWPLFRFDPSKPKGKKFKLDSKQPSMPIEEFMYNETRFKRVAKENAELGDELLKQAQEEVDTRWERLELFRNM